jgi:hypothetical protein
MEIKITDLLDCIQDDTVHILDKDIASLERVKELSMKKATNSIIEKRKRISSKAILIAATISILVVSLVGTAFATNLFGVRDMLLQGDVLMGPFLVDNEGKEIINPSLPWEDFVAANPDATEVELKFDYIAVSGLPGSSEFEAAQMWWRMHMMPYDGQVLSPEEIAEEHGLIYQGDDNITNYYEIDRNNFEPFLNRIAFGPFLDESLRVFPGYVYDLGTFSLDGFYGYSEFSIRYTRKGTFDIVFRPSSDIKTHEQWSYVNAGGTEMLLIQGETESIIIVDKEEAFIMISVIGGSVPTQWYNMRRFSEAEAYDLYKATGDESYLDKFGPEMVDLLITRSDLEQFADMIDFNKLK